jgi:hypothetical protein
MPLERPLFSRPIVVSSVNDSFRATVSSSNYDVTLTNGVYPCIRRLCDEWSDKLQAVIDTWQVTFNATTYKIALTHSGGGTWSSVTWTDTALRDLLGYTGSETITANVLTATYCPSTVWFPTFTPADQEAWRTQQRELFSGITARNGRNVGNRTGPTIYSRTFSFVHELAERCFVEFTTNAYEAERTFERFILNARTAPNSAGDVSSKGFYVYHDMNNALREQYTTMDDGGVEINYSSSPETYIYCHPDPEGVDIGSASLPNARQRYNINSFRVHSATAPTWSAP